MKVAELKKLEQESKIIEEFIQEFRRAVKESGYKKRPLVEKFKRGIDGTVRRRLMKAEHQLSSIKQ